MDPLPELNDGRLYELLAASGSQARASVRLLACRTAEGGLNPAALDESAKESARITDEIRAHLLCADFVSLPKADIEALAEVLARIPSSAKRFAERFGLATDHREDVDFVSCLNWLEELSEMLIDMIRQLRGFESLAQIKDLCARLQRMADHAEARTEEIVTRAYQQPATPLRIMMVKDLGDRLQAIIDHYREAAGLMNRIALACF